MPPGHLPCRQTAACRDFFQIRAETAAVADRDLDDPFYISGFGLAWRPQTLPERRAEVFIGDHPGPVIHRDDGVAAHPFGHASDGRGVQRGSEAANSGMDGRTDFAAELHPNPAVPQRQEFRCHRDFSLLSEYYDSPGFISCCSA